MYVELIVLKTELAGDAGSAEDAYEGNMSLSPTYSPTIGRPATAKVSRNLRMVAQAAQHCQSAP